MTEQHEDSDTNRPENRRGNNTDYNKMIAHEDYGTAKGSGVPEQTTKPVGGGNVGSGAVPNDIEAEGSSTGGRNTTNSTVSGGSTAGGTNIGLGATRDRGTMNNAPDLSQNSQPIMGTPPLRADAEAHNPVPLEHTKSGQVEKSGQIVPEKNPLDKDPCFQVSRWYDWQSPDVTHSGHITIMITHRLVGLEMADEILVLQVGKIKELDTHPELLQAEGLYWRLCHLQKQMIFIF